MAMDSGDSKGSPAQQRFGDPSCASAILGSAGNAPATASGAAGIAAMFL